MKIMLAPMEGVIDHHMRAILTDQGGYDACVTEFLRVVDQRLPKRVFYRLCPELAQGGTTPSGVPVILQLLGGIPEAMAANAARGVALGAPGIDINFGCPSRFVNRKAGGAILLKEPERIEAIVRAVRQAVPEHIPVSAKIRLGYDSTALALDNAHAVEAGGAAFITVHARTKADGYRPPADWQWLARIREALTIPVVANGDINSVDDYQRCRQISACDDIMLGRGAIASPNLAAQIKQNQTQDMDWPHIAALIHDMATRMSQQPDTRERYILGRIKQWTTMIRRQHPQADTWFGQIRQIKDYQQLMHTLQLQTQASRMAPS